jgi:predicted phage baseplate assembly protein
MKTLAPNLFDERFDDLMKIGRARLRALAPDWTDNNAHDPGITLMELFAWASEAQLYSLARMRRDERAAYAAFLGITSAGTRGATGVIWSDRTDPSSPLATYTATKVLPQDAVISMAGTPVPTFRPLDKLLWVPGRIRALQTRTARGRTTDLTANNARGNLNFLPFGDRAGPGSVLSIDFVCNDASGLFGADRKATTESLWPIGILAAAPLTGPAADPTPPAGMTAPGITATLVDGDDRYPLRVARDTTRGLLSSGVLLLDLSSVATSPAELTIELRAPRGFARPPRWLRVEPSVIPIRQGRVIANELNYSIAAPNWSFTLAAPGVRFDAGEEPVTVAVVDSDSGLATTWKRVDRLIDYGPSDAVYEYDAAAGQITFGNGLNGRMAPDQAQVLATYAVSDADRGNVGRNRKWQVAGFEGVVGVNLDQVTGGAGASAPGGMDQRREARSRAVIDHALVSSDDIIQAAKALPLLEVARAWISTPGTTAPRTGVVTLVVMRARSGPNEPPNAPETARWLAEIRRQLTSRMPLGSRLAVVGPTYVPFSLSATIQCARGLNPDTVKSAAETTLSKRLMLVGRPDADAARQPGVGVTIRDLTTWIRSTPGVTAVSSVQLSDADGRSVQNGVTVPGDGFPKWLIDSSSISVSRPASGSAP